LILSNFKKESNYSRLVPTIAALTINKLYDYLGLTANINEESGKKYTGTFKTDKGDTLHISMENNRLIMKTKNRESVLQHLKKDTFLIEGALEDRIEFSFRKIKGLKLKRRRSMEIQAIEI
jgi:alkyl sulfatase BDS1-like metallo-beta-lactamase superfamily hydrolase